MNHDICEYLDYLLLIDARRLILSWGCVWSYQDLARQASSKSCAKLKQAAPVHPCTRGIPFILNISPGKTIRIPSAPIRADTSTQVSRITRLTSPGMALPLFASAVGGYNAALPGRIGRDLILRKL